MNHPLSRETDERLRALADPALAPGMQAYMKHVQPFLGVPAPVRRAAVQEQIRNHRRLAETDWEFWMLDLWNGPFREHRYAALQVAQAYKAFLTPAQLPLFTEISKGCDWWDTTDDLATHVFNPVYLKFRVVEPLILKFREQPLLWHRRISILAHLNHRDRTRFEVLDETVGMLGAEKEFFIRKALGWVLRHLGRTHPDYVHGVLEKYRDRLAPLTVREASKYLTHEDD